jgi:AraC family transcriptional regulator
MVRRLEPGTFIGEARSAAHAGAVLSEVTHNEGHEVPEHSHEWSYVSLLLHGTYSETVADRTIEYTPFTAVFHAPDLTHRDVIGDAGGRFFIAELGPAWCETIESLGGVPNHVCELHGEGASWPMLHLYHAMIAHDLTDDCVEEGLLQLCSYLPRAPRVSESEPLWLREVEEWLVKHFREPYSLQTLAEAVHVNPSHLARTFNRFRHRTIGDFVSRLRVQEACRRLAHVELSLEAIAQESGFSDQSHMTRTIRKTLGNTPANLRRVLQ